LVSIPNMIEKGKEGGVWEEIDYLGKGLKESNPL